MASATRFSFERKEIKEKEKKGQVALNYQANGK